MQKNKGFTLIETMIVIAIFGLITAIAVPYFQRRSNPEYNSFMRECHSKNPSFTIQDCNGRYSEHNQWEKYEH